MFTKEQDQEIMKALRDGPAMWPVHRFSLWARFKTASYDQIEARAAELLDALEVVGQR